MKISALRLGIGTAMVAAMLVGAPAQAVLSPAWLASDDQTRALQCLTLAIAYEAGFEAVSGREAVAEVILNRVRHPAFPKSVCGVVFQGSSRSTGCQFTFTCDGALKRRLPESVIIAARAIAASALAGGLASRVGGATHYHANYVTPYWSSSLIRTTQIGAHIFYRQSGTPDQPLQLAGYRARGEPLFDAMATGAPIGVLDQGPAARGTAAKPASSPAPFAPWGLAPPRG